MKELMILLVLCVIFYLLGIATALLEDKETPCILPRNEAQMYNGY